MSEQLDSRQEAEVIDLAAARRRRTLGLRAMEAADQLQFPDFLDVKLGDEDDSPVVTAIIVPESPTAYSRALAHGKKTEGTVLWGRVRPVRQERDITPGYKMAIMFKRNAADDAGLRRAAQAVADLAGPGHRFDISEYYHQESWPSVTLPSAPEYELAA